MKRKKKGQGNIRWKAKLIQTHKNSIWSFIMVLRERKLTVKGSEKRARWKKFNIVALVNTSTLASISATKCKWQPERILLESARWLIFNGQTTERIKLCAKEKQRSREVLTWGVKQIMSMEETKGRWGQQEARPRSDEEKNGETRSLIDTRVWSRGFRAR